MCVGVVGWVKVARRGSGEGWRGREINWSWYVIVDLNLGVEDDGEATSIVVVVVAWAYGSGRCGGATGRTSIGAILVILISL